MIAVFLHTRGGKDVGARAGRSLLCGYVGVQLHHIKLNTRRHFSVCQGHRFGNGASPSIILSEPI